MKSKDVLCFALPIWVGLGLWVSINAATGSVTLYPADPAPSLPLVPSAGAEGQRGREILILSSTPETGGLWSHFGFDDMTKSHYWKSSQLFLLCMG